MAVMHRRCQRLLTLVDSWLTCRVNGELVQLCRFEPYMSSFLMFYKRHVLLLALQYLVYGFILWLTLWTGWRLPAAANWFSTHIKI